ncbi:uncharacterized protein BDV17DRAFT_25283 [Aspergillus undulatus]|uniref:uncharacterized protein n=1 Tax=Aspergillus undulatus TaxID=1810928 RepID=UPI003CCD2CE2
MASSSKKAGFCRPSRKLPFPASVLLPVSTRPTREFFAWRLLMQRTPNGVLIDNCVQNELRKIGGLFRVEGFMVGCWR